MTVKWMPQALAHLEAIFDYIAEDNPQAAHTLVDQLADSVERTLGTQALAGRPGRVVGTREWVAHRSYIVAYQVTADGDVEVLAVVHGARLWPDQL